MREKKPTYETFEQRFKELAKKAVERGWMEEALREFEQGYRSIFEVAPASLILIDKDGQIVDINPYHLSHIAKGKCTKKDLIGKNILTYPSVVNSGLSETYKRLLEGEPFDQQEVYFPTLERGDDGYFNVKGVPFLKGGEVIGAIIIHEDITESKRTEEAIKGAEQEKATILNTLVEHVIHQDTTMKMLWANRAACESAGLTREEVLGHHCYEIWAQRKDPCPDCPVVKAIETGRPQEVEKLTPDGKAWFIRGYPQRDEKGEIVGAIEVTLDITERRKAEEALRESEKKYSTLVENSLTGIYIDQGGKIVFANNKFAEIYKYPKDDLIGMESWKLVHPEDRALTDEIRTKRLRGEDAPSEYEARGLRKDGKTIWIARKNTRIEYKGKSAILGNIVEITGHKRAEEALRESYEFTSSALVHAPNPILVINPDTSIRYVNPSLEELTGFSSGELIGKKTPYPWWPEETLQKISKDLHEGMVKEAQRLKELFQKKNGDLFHVEITLTAIRRNGKLKYYLVNWVDITERTQAEEAIGETIKRMQIAYEQSIIYARQLNREIAERKRVEETLLTSHEKLQSLASKLSLAEERQRRRVAIEVHDRISQNLAFLKMKVGALRPSIASGGALETMDEVLKLVDETIQNTRSLISELGSPILYELGFVPAVEWLTQQAQRQHGIVVDFEDDGQPKPLSEDVGVLLFQAARELLVNIAKHAKARTAKVSITRDDNQIRVDVEDDGVGFDSAEIGSSVDTTGRFGLFSIRVRLEPLGGHMEVDSKPGHGTRVTLIAPLKHNGGNKKEKVS